MPINKKLFSGDGVAVLRRRTAKHIVLLNNKINIICLLFQHSVKGMKKNTKLLSHDSRLRTETRISSIWDICNLLNRSYIWPQRTWFLDERTYFHPVLRNVRCRHTRPLPAMYQVKSCIIIGSSYVTVANFNNCRKSVHNNAVLNFINDGKSTILKNIFFWFKTKWLELLVKQFFWIQSTHAMS
jgi:hypothetical protein